MVRALIAAGAAAVAFGAVADGRSADAGTLVLRATVTRVVDGDTLDVRIGKVRDRIRLMGIDTPELSPAECYGAQAKRRAHTLAQGRNVVLVGDATQAARDRYGRRLAYVTLPGGADLGRLLIAGGYGEVYVFARAFARVGAYRAAETAARATGRGRWSLCARAASPSPPPSASCAASYPDVCIPPPPPDLDCGQIPHRRFRVRHDVASPDPHRFDGDRDGVGCES